jgi:DNA-binding NarL/FixJ family response regulator
MAIRHEVPSALRQAAQAVATTRGRLLQLRRTFEQSLIPMVRVDNDRHLLDVNAAAKFVSRMSLQELRQLQLDDLTAGQDLSALKEAWDELFRRGTLSDRYRVTFTDGSTLAVFYAAIANALPGRHLIVFVPADWPGNELEALQPAMQPALRGPLSPRQVEVLRLVAIGASAAEIADELSISEATVRTHVKNILERLAAKNRAHAVALAMCDGLLGDAREQENSIASTHRGNGASTHRGDGASTHRGNGESIGRGNGESIHRGDGKPIHRGNSDLVRDPEPERRGRSQ